MPKKSKATATPACMCCENAAREGARAGLKESGDDDDDDDDYYHHHHHHHYKYN